MDGRFGWSNVIPAEAGMQFFLFLKGRNSNGI
jgi:hypothetical protein